MSQRRILLWATLEASGAAHVRPAAQECEIELQTCSYEEIFQRLRQDASVVLGVELGEGSSEQGLALVVESQRQFPSTPVLVASREASPNVMRAAFKAGACDVVILPVNPADLRKAFADAQSQASSAADIEGGNGKVITIFGARGGLGVTTLAVNLSVQLVKLSQGNVALADFDLQRGDCAAFLNLTPSQTMSTMASSSGELDDLILFSTLIRHPSGVALLAAPQHIEEADVVGPEEAEAAVQILRRRFPYTVIDTSRTLSAITAGILAHSDRVLVLTDLSLPGVRAAHRIVGVLRGMEVSREALDLIIVQGEHDIVPLPDAIRAVGKDPILKLPRDLGAATMAMNAGAPLNGPRPSPLLVSIIELASKLSGLEASAMAKRGLLQQFFSRGGKA